MLMLDISELRRLSGALKELEPEENRALQKRIRTVAEPIARQVRLAALQLPSDPSNKRVRLGSKALKSGQRLGLRAGLAASVEVRTRSGKSNPGVRIVLSRSMFAKQTGKPASLPYHVENPSGRDKWRHPFMADRTKPRSTWKWYAQKARPFLLPTVLPHKTEVRDAIITEYMDTFEARLRRHGIPVR